MASGKGGWGEQGDAAFVAGLMQILSQGNGSLAFCEIAKHTLRFRTHPTSLLH